MTLRVASVPSGHVYVRHLADGHGEPVQRLPDPSPGAGAPAGQWWPPRMLEGGWVAEHSTEFDLMHIHFGFDAVSPADLRALVDELRAAGKPLVLTVHDLRNPHHREPGLHDDQLSVLVAGADALMRTAAAAAPWALTPWLLEQLEELGPGALNVGRSDEIPN